MHRLCRRDCKRPRCFVEYQAGVSLVHSILAGAACVSHRNGVGELRKVLSDGVLETADHEVNVVQNLVVEF